MNAVKSIFALALCFFVIGTFAQPAPSKFPPNSGLKLPDGLLPSPGQSSIKNQIDRVKSTKRLPVNGMVMVETTDGKVVLVSENGRLAIIGGRWVDLWEGTTITSIADSASLDKVNFARMGLNVDEFEPYIIGNGPKTVIVFVDPTSDESRSLVRQMAGQGKQYTFKVVILPLKGAQSGQLARRMHCSPDKKLALDAFINSSFTSLPESPASCNVMPIQKAMITSTVLSIHSTPYLVLPDNTTASVTSVNVSLSDVLSHK